MRIYNNIKHIKEEPLEHEQYIYVIENDRKDIKVGITKNPRRRFKSLSGSNAGGSSIVRMAVSQPTWLYSIEKTVHNHYARNRIKGSEWFIGITFEEVIEFIDTIFNSSSYERINNTRKDFTLKKLKKCQ